MKSTRRGLDQHFLEVILYVEVKRLRRFPVLASRTEGVNSPIAS